VCLCFGGTGDDGDFDVTVDGVIDLTSPEIPIAQPVLGLPRPGSPGCALPGCTLSRFRKPDGRPYDYCRRSHAQDHRRMIEAAAEAGVPPDSPPPLVPLMSVVITADLATQDSVARQRSWMAKQLGARTEPRPCRFNGSRPCPLCGTPFQVGQEIVKCYAHGAGQPPWVHVACVDEILRRRNMPTIG